MEQIVKAVKMSGTKHKDMENKESRTANPEIAKGLLNSVKNSATVNQNYKNKLFYGRSANQRIDDAKTKPIPKMLFGELWFQGEITILFSDTNLGKSALAVMVADSITKGSNIQPFEMEATPQKVLYLDFEMSDKQFEKRYSQNFRDHYQFSNDFIICELLNYVDYSDFGYETYQQFLEDEIEKLVKRSGSKVLIVDNITYLGTKLEKSDGAIPLMKFLYKLKKENDLSILVLAHTPKRDETRPISMNDLGGSKHLQNFCDAMTAIGRSQQGNDIRYLKQLKMRSCPERYGIEYVPSFKLEQSGSFLGFYFLDFCHENEHLKNRTAIFKEKETKIWDVYENNPGMSFRRIAEVAESSKSTVERVIKKKTSTIPIDGS
jgi:hypothetical protein